MINVEISESTVDTVSGVAKKSGRGYCFYNQPGILRCPGDFGFQHLDGKPVVVSLEEATPLAVGEYRISPRSFYLDNFGKLCFVLRVEPEPIS